MYYCLLLCYLIDTETKRNKPYVKVARGLCPTVDANQLMIMIRKLALIIILYGWNETVFSAQWNSQKKKSKRIIILSIKPLLK